MSHTVKIESKLTDLVALEAAAREQGAEFKRTERVHLYAGDVPAVASVKLVGWTYPVAVQQDGTLAIDNFGGRWGNPQALAALRQQYGAEVVRKTMGAGWRIAQTAQPDGTLRMVLTR